MEITGARWGPQGAEAVPRLPALKSNKDFDANWRFNDTENANESTKPATPVGSSPPHRTRHDVPPGKNPHP